MRRLIGLSALALVVAGCSSNTPAAPASPTTTTVKVVTAKTSDYAKVIAENHGEWTDEVTTVKRDCLDPETIPACYAGYLTIGLMGETLNLSLTALHSNRSAPGYIGDPPAEIADLVQETEAAALAVQQASEALQADTACDDPTALECGEIVPMESTIDDLSGKLDAWSVYS
jgi:hypothetical protein